MSQKQITAILTCSVSYCGNFREQLKMFNLVCVLFYIKVEMWNITDASQIIPQ